MTMNVQPADDKPWSLDGCVAMVTGGGGGIGRASAHRLAGAGAAIAVTDIDAAAAARVAEELMAAGFAASAHGLDVTDEGSVNDVTAAIAERHGRIDVLVNSAGIGMRGPSETLPIESWSRVIAVNLTGTFLCAREAGRRMLAQGSGAVVNIASIMGVVGNALYPHAAYHASKGAVVNLTRALAVEWAARGVRVNAVAPTFVATRLTERLLADEAIKNGIIAHTPMGRLATVEEVADAVLYLASPGAAMVTGQVLAVDGGWLAR